MSTEYNHDTYMKLDKVPLPPYHKTLAYNFVRLKKEPSERTIYFEHGDTFPGKLFMDTITYKVLEMPSELRLGLCISVVTKPALHIIQKVA